MQRQRREDRDGFAGRSDKQRIGRVARQRMGRAPAIGNGGAGGDAGHDKPTGQHLQHGRLTAMQMVGAGRIDDDPVRRVGGDDR